MEGTMKTFHWQKIKQFRDEAGLTQDELAAKIGVIKQQISAWENSDPEKSLTTAYLSKIADALNKTPDDFFFDGSQP